LTININDERIDDYSDSQRKVAEPTSNFCSAGCYSYLNENVGGATVNDSPNNDEYL
jgi:hypothetical protein